MQLLLSWWLPAPGPRRCIDASGDHDAAKAAIAKARERLFVIAGKIDDPAYRKSFLENVPENRRTLELAQQWLGEEM